MLPIDSLRRYPVFNLLNAHQLSTWLTSGQELSFALGETIFQEGSAGVWIYLLLDGRVRILRRSNSNRDVTVGSLGPGEIFGEHALLKPHRNIATCRAATALRVLRLPLLPLMPLLSTHPEIGPGLKNWLRLHALLGYLREQSFLGFMSAPSALKFLDRLQPMEINALRTIQADGLCSDRWFFVQEGQIFLHPPSVFGDEEPRELGPGDCFGEGALLSRGGLPIAVAHTNARCLCLSRSEFAPPAHQNSDAGISARSLELQPNSLLKIFTWVGQREDADCGPAALTMLAKYLGVPADIEKIRSEIDLTTSGARLSQLRKASISLGLHCVAVRIAVERLRQLEPPAIAHYRSGHYVVLYECADLGVVVGDPATGIIRMSRSSFMESCSGNFLVLRPAYR
jgi:CRP-like cAMP-binding protein